MIENDAAVIGTELYSGDDAMLEKIRQSKRIDQFISPALKRVRLTREDLVYDPRFNEATNNIEHGYKVRSIPQVDAPYTELKVEHRIIIANSYRPTGRQLKKQLSAYFSVELFKNAEGTAALAYCKLKS